MRKYGRTDANQAEIVKALEALGASVQSLSDIGNGCPDLLVGYNGRNLLIEVKDGSKPPSRTLLTPDQAKWHKNWKGSRIFVVYGDSDVKNLFDVLFGWV